MEQNAVNLSIKNVPEKVVKRLRKQAEMHHRSLQGELLAILERASGSRRALTATEVYERVRRLGLRTPDDGTAIIRAARDAR
jgi:plasmid stability protein